jgi:hypothetical protein
MLLSLEARTKADLKVNLSQKFPVSSDHFKFVVSVLVHLSVCLLHHLAQALKWRILAINACAVALEATSSAVRTLKDSLNTASARTISEEDQSSKTDSSGDVDMGFGRCSPPDKCLSFVRESPTPVSVGAAT